MTPSRHHVCEANNFGRVTTCGRCSLQWVTNATERPSCKPKAEPPISIADMIEYIVSEANNTLASQRALAASGYGPHMPELRKAAVLFAAARFLGWVEGNEKVLALYKEGG